MHMYRYGGKLQLASRRKGYCALLRFSKTKPRLKLINLLLQTPRADIHQEHTCTFSRR